VVDQKQLSALRNLNFFQGFSPHFKDNEALVMASKWLAFSPWPVEPPFGRSVLGLEEVRRCLIAGVGMQAWSPRGTPLSRRRCRN
jgi:hypothetical protein